VLFGLCMEVAVCVLSYEINMHVQALQRAVHAACTVSICIYSTSSVD
jgi:hypothetical protein